MSKAPDAFRTISEVSEILETPPHVLRFWETKFTQLKPVKRAGGRRYYRPSDLELLGGIKRLLHEDGMTIRGVQKMLRERGVKHVAALSPPLEIDAEIEAPADQPAATAGSRPLQAVAPPAPDPASKSRDTVEERRAIVPSSPPGSGQPPPQETEQSHPDDAEAPGLPFDSPLASPPPAAGADSGDAAQDDSPEAEAEADALAARIRELSEGENGPSPSEADRPAPPPADTGAQAPDPVPREPPAAPPSAADAVEPPSPAETEPAAPPQVARPVAQSPSDAEDDDARPGIATLLRRLDGPLPAARATALRPLVGRMEALNARLAEADDAAAG